MASQSTDNRGRPLKAVLGVVLVVGLALAIGLGRQRLPDAEAVVALLKQLGEVNPLVYVAVYTALTALLVPVALLILSSGFILGYMGIPVVLVAAVLGSTLSFLVSRFLLHEAVDRFIEARPRLQALQGAVARDATRLIVFLRVSPVMPFGVFNYVAGALPVTPLRFTVATAVGLLPRVAGGVMVGSGGRAVLEAGSLSALGPRALVAYGLLIGGTAAVVVVLGRIAREALKGTGVEGAAPAEAPPGSG